eukprot:Awhi_evm1s14499
MYSIPGRSYFPKALLFLLLCIAQFQSNQIVRAAGINQKRATDYSIGWKTLILTADDESAVLPKQ